MTVATRLVLLNHIWPFVLVQLEHDGCWLEQSLEYFNLFLPISSVAWPWSPSKCFECFGVFRNRASSFLWNHFWANKTLHLVFIVTSYFTSTNLRNSCNPTPQLVMSDMCHTFKQLLCTWASFSKSFKDLIMKSISSQYNINSFFALTDALRT